MVNKRVFLIFLIFVLIIPFAFSLSVTPARTVVFFEPGLIKEVSVHVGNDDNKNVNGNFSIFGEAENYTDFKSYEYTFEPKETKSVKFNITLPLQCDRPGDYKFTFVASEIAKEEGSNFINVLTAAGSVFIIRAPYEGYYLSASLGATSVSVGEYVPFNLILENIGNLPINNIDGNIEIFDDLNKSVGKVEFEESLAVSENKRLKLNWNSENNTFGSYRAVAILNFNGKTIEVEDEFKLGDIHISILDYDKSIDSNKINKYHVKIKSDWGDKITNVVITLDIYHNPFKSFKTYNFDIDPWKEQNPVIYVDAEEMSNGKYPALLSVIYDGITTKEEFEINIKSFDFNYILYGVIIFIVVFVLGYIVILKLKKGKKK